MTPPTPEQVAAYFKADGMKCLYCGSSDIEGESVTVDGGGAWQDISCSECHATWSDIYTLTNVLVGDDLHAPGDAAGEATAATVPCVRDDHRHISYTEDGVHYNGCRDCKTFWPVDADGYPAMPANREE